MTNVKFIEVAAECVGKVEEYVAKLNRRAAKIGCEPLMMSVVGTRIEELVGFEGEVQEIATIEIVGTTPVINGWKFVGRIEHTENGNVLRVAPGESIPTQYWESAGECDHCNTKRHRNDTFILLNVATGEYKQIGRQCVRDYIGYDNPADMYWWTGVLDTFATESEEGAWGVRTIQTYSIDYILRLSLAAIAQFGFVSNKMAQDQDRESTRNFISHCMTYRRVPVGDRRYDPRAESVRTAAEEPSDEAIKIVEWVKSWVDSEVMASEFMFNVRNFVRSGVCRMNAIGFIVCLPTMYAREMDKLNPKVVKSNEWVGEVKVRQTFNVKIVSIFVMDGFYGVNHRVNMEDEAGNCLTWVASNFGDFKVGDEVAVTGSVKEHSEYKGRKQTVLTRCKLVAR